MSTRHLARVSVRFPAAVASAALRPEVAGRLLSGRNLSVGHAASSSMIKVPYLLRQSLRYSAMAFQRFGFSSSASPETNKDETQTGEQVNATKPVSDSYTDNDSSEEEADADFKSHDPRLHSKKEEADADTELEPSKEDLVKLAAEMEELLNSKDDEIKTMKDKVLHSYAEMENVMDRTRRESENAKKFAIQSFAKGLLDVADNLGRASSVVKESFSKLDVSKDAAGAVPLVKTLLEGVEMTDKQLTDVFKKYGVEKFDPLNEKFDPNRHDALFPVSDPSKPPGTVATVVKPGYMLHDRVLRPAEVGVTEGAADETDEKSSE